MLVNDSGWYVQPTGGTKHSVLLPVCWAALERSSAFGLIACFCIAWKLRGRVSSRTTPKHSCRRDILVLDRIA